MIEAKMHQPLNAADLRDDLPGRSDTAIRIRIHHLRAKHGVRADTGCGSPSMSDESMSRAASIRGSQLYAEAMSRAFVIRPAQAL